MPVSQWLCWFPRCNISLTQQLDSGGATSSQGLGAAYLFFLAVLGLPCCVDPSLVVLAGDAGGTGGSSLLWCRGFPLPWLLLCSSGSRTHGLQ